MALHSDLSKEFEVSYLVNYHKLHVENSCLLQGGVPSRGENLLLNACAVGNLQLPNKFIEINPLHVAAIHDREDHTAFMHISTSHNFIKIQDLLLFTNYSTSSPLVASNSLNDQEGHSILDIHYETWSIPAVQGPLLDAAAVVGNNPSENYTGRSNSSKSGETESEKISSLQLKNVILMVLVMAVTFFFTSSSSPPNHFFDQSDQDNVVSKSVSIWELMIGPSEYQAIFYYMISSIAGFIVSMAALVYLMWPLPFGPLVNFVLFILLINYVLLVKMTTPFFLIIICSSRISSCNFMALSTIAFLCCALMASFLKKSCGSFCLNRKKVVTGELVF